MSRKSILATLLLVATNAVEYVVVKESLRWTSARAACQELGSGWDLASIHSRGANDDLMKIAADKGIDHCWIGLNDATTEGTFVWSDGTDSDLDFFEYWGPGQPDNGGGVEDYAHLRISTRDWNDISGDGGGVVNGYACGKNEYAEISVSFADVAVIFKMPTGYTYQRASLWCSANGLTEMTSIHDGYVNQAIQDSMNDLELSHAWIGLQSVADGNGYIWKWDDGSALNYDEFAAGEESAIDGGRGIFNSETGHWENWQRDDEAMGVICTGHSFALHLQASGGWNEANDICASTYDRGHLITIHSEMRNEELKHAFQINYEAEFVAQAVFIGYRDNEDEGHWYWSDGSPDVFNDFTANQPDNLNGNQDCGSIWYSGSVYGWDDTECDNVNWGFVCAVPAGHANSVVTKDGSIRVTKFYGNFFEGEEYCQSTYGTNVASIHDDTVNEYVRVAAVSLGLDRVWIGYYAATGQTWEWTDETTYGFENWASGQPVAHEHAQMKASDGLWENVAGGNQYAGIACNMDNTGMNSAPLTLKSDVNDKKQSALAHSQTTYTKSQLFAAGAVSLVGLAIVYNIYNKRPHHAGTKKTLSTAYGAV